MAPQEPISFPGFQPPTDWGAGVSIRAKQPTSAQPLKPQYSQASRALSLAAYFLGGSVAINASQALGTPLYLVNKEWYNAWIAFTKQSWGLLTMTMTQWWAPTVVRVSGDSTMRGQLLQTSDGGLLCNFPERLVLIANHQIYTDWLYLWWIGYAAGMHGRIYVVLKKSLKRIPVIGWGMQFAQFIFLKRKWEEDKPHLAAHMQKFNNQDPMWLMMFPEGTNLATCTREKSRKFAEANGIKDMQHTLLPRSTGLHFMLKELRSTVDYVYDCTIAYEGVARGEYAQDIFTVGASYFGGRPPKSVNMYWRRFRVADIPLDDPKLFEVWLRARWSEKDKFVERYYQKGRFPADSGSTKDQAGKTLTGAGYIEAEVKPKRWYEFLQVFAPIGLLSLVLYFFYGALPQDVIKKIGSIDQKTMMKTIDAIQKGEIKIPETKDIMATAPKHLQNRFDAVKKLAEARGTTPEKVIAQLQTIDKPGNGDKTNQIQRKPAQPPSRTAAKKPTGALQKTPTAAKATIKGNDAAKKTTAHPPRTSTANKSATSTGVEKTNPGVKSSAVPAKPKTNAVAPKLQPQKLNSRGPSKPQVNPSQSSAAKKATTTPSVIKPAPTAQKSVTAGATKPVVKTDPHQEQSTGEDVRKARKKMEVRQGKQESKRKTRRTVEVGRSDD